MDQKKKCLRRRRVVSLYQNKRRCDYSKRREGVFIVEEEVEKMSLYQESSLFDTGRSGGVLEDEKCLKRRRREGVVKVEEEKV